MVLLGVLSPLRLLSEGMIQLEEDCVLEGDSVELKRVRLVRHSHHLIYHQRLPFKNKRLDSTNLRHQASEADDVCIHLLSLLLLEHHDCLEQSKEVGVA